MVAAVPPRLPTNPWLTPRARGLSCADVTVRARPGLLNPGDVANGPGSFFRRLVGDGRVNACEWQSNAATRAREPTPGRLGRLDR